MSPILALDDVGKTFTMHLRGGISIPVVSGVSFSVAAGECVALDGPSGAGKSSILKMIFGSYAADRGCILLRAGARIVDVACADARTILDLRRDIIGYVSQFLRVVPRISAREVVAEPQIARGAAPDDVMARAGTLLDRLNVPRRLWDHPPATLSGGERQRVNIARGLSGGHALLLLDEPTASLDADNRKIVIELIREKKADGAAILVVLHDADARAAVADRSIDVSLFTRQTQESE